MQQLKASVIIPTYNRKRVLKRCLAALTRQSCHTQDFEVLVVDDGSRDGTCHMLRKYKTQTPLQFRCFIQEHKGPAAARNLGIKQARGALIIFIGDDILADPRLIQKHLEAQQRYPEHTAVIGHISWARDLPITPFMQYLEERKLLFHYQDIPDPDNAPYHFFYTCNVSLSKKLLLQECFDEDYKHAMYEDVELAYRLISQGVRFVYADDAIGFHFHPMILRHFLKRAFASGFYTILTNQKHPKAIALSGPTAAMKYRRLKFMLYPVLTRIISPLDYFFRIDCSPLYAKLIDYYKLKGLEKGRLFFFNHEDKQAMGQIL
jgi:glycosyltransferase involved in cell wall biosynthesis